MTCGIEKPGVKYKNRDMKHHHKETSYQSGSTKIVSSGKAVGVSHGPRASGASEAGGGLTASSHKEHHAHVGGLNLSHAKRGMN